MNEEKNRGGGNQFADQVNFQQGVNKFRMFVIYPWEFIAHLFAPDRHGQESQRRIIEAVIVLVRLFFYPVVERQISTEQSCPRIGRRVVGR